MPRRLLLLGAALLVLSGCGVAETQNTQAYPTFPPTAQVASLHLPFDLYSLSLSDLYTIDNADDVLINKCMKAKHLDWRIIDRPMDTPDLRNRRRYGVIEAPIARFGYHVPDGLLTPLNVEIEYDKRDTGITKEIRSMAFGPQGCGHKAAQQLTSDDSKDQAILAQHDRASLSDTQKSPAVATAMKLWQACMRQAGFTYATPLTAAADPRWWKDPNANPSQKEIAVASADVRCKDQTNLITIWSAAEIQYQNTAVHQHATYFKKRRAEVVGQVEAAKKVLAGARH